MTYDEAVDYLSYVSELTDGRREALIQAILDEGYHNGYKDGIGDVRSALDRLA